MRAAATLSLRAPTEIKPFRAALWRAAGVRQGGAEAFIRSGGALLLSSVHTELYLRVAESRTASPYPVSTTKFGLLDGTCLRAMEEY